MVDGTGNPEQQIAGRAESLRQEKKPYKDVVATYNDLLHKQWGLQQKMQEEYERNASNPQTFLAFLEVHRDFALVSRHRDDLWGERGKTELLLLAVRCQRALNGDERARAAFCSQEALDDRQMAQESSTRPDAFYRDYRQSFLATGIRLPYPKDWKGKKLEDMTEEEWIAIQRGQDQERAAKLLKEAAAWTAMADAIKTRPA